MTELKLPWKVELGTKVLAEYQKSEIKDLHFCHILNEYDNVVVAHLGKDEAVFIVRAVNCHERAKGHLKKLREILEALAIRAETSGDANIATAIGKIKREHDDILAEMEADHDRQSDGD